MLKAVEVTTKSEIEEFLNFPAHLHQKFSAYIRPLDEDIEAVFDPAMKMHGRLGKEGMARGLICYPMGGTIDGVQGDHVSLAPPYNASDEELALAVDLLGEAVDAAVASS